MKNNNELYTIENVEMVDFNSYQGEETESIETLENELNKSGYFNSTIKQFMNEIGKYELLTAEEEITLAEEVKKGNKEARDRYVNSNLRLVVCIARRYINQSRDLVDLIQDGTAGLIKAVDKFDPTRGYRFSTYATWWIRQGITRGIMENGRTIRVPVHMNDHINRVKRIERELETQYGRTPNFKEISDASEGRYTEKKVEEILLYSRDAVSADKPIGDENDTTLLDFVVDENRMNDYEQVDNNEVNSLLNEIIDKYLTSKEAWVIRERFGFDYARPRTLEELGDEMGVTRERVRQIESKAMRKLARPQIQILLKDCV